MDLAILKAEIDNDHISRGYSELSDAEIADSLNNILDRTVNRDFVSPEEMQSAVIGSDFIAISAIKQRAWLAILTDNVNPNNSNTITQISSIWPASETLDNLADLRTELGSRAKELDLGQVTPSDVAKAKAL